MRKPEIEVGKSNGSRDSVWDTSDDMDFELMQFFYSLQSVQLIRIFFIAGRFLTTSNFIVLCLCRRHVKEFRF